MYAIRSYYDSLPFDPVPTSYKEAMIELDERWGVITSYSIHYTKLYDMVLFGWAIIFFRENKKVLHET